MEQITDTEFQSIVASLEALDWEVSLPASDEDDDSPLYAYDDEDYAYEASWDEDEYGILNYRIRRF